MLELLRGIAIASQREEPQGFYPLREVARHFTVPLSTVSRVYGELEEEGILASVRGSKHCCKVSAAVDILACLALLECQRLYLLRYSAGLPHVFHPHKA